MHADDAESLTLNDQTQPEWLKNLERRLLNNPAIRWEIRAGRFGYSIESIIRLCLGVDAARRVHIDQSNLHRCLMHLASDAVHPDIRSWALVVIAQAVIANDPAYRLDLKQRTPGRVPQQKSDQLAQMVKLIPIAKTAEEAERRGERSPNKFAAREHRCSVQKVQRPRALTREIRRRAEEEGQTEPPNSNI